MIYIGTAGWNIPRLHAHHFAVGGSQLQRYASRLNAAEINSSFYRSHDPRVYERWAASVPPDFRFSVKIPKSITHEGRLLRSREPLTRFLDETSALGSKLGPLLLQLPPSFEFDSRRVGRFLSLLRGRHDRDVVCEPRHHTWTSAAADRLLQRFRIARVAADPPRARGLGAPGGWEGTVYYRWHGSPRPYFSPYSGSQLRELAATLQAKCGTHRDAAPDCWCVFDNTGSGAAAGDAVELTSLVIGEPATPTPPSGLDRLNQ